MGIPLRLAVLFVQPEELETIRHVFEAEGERVEFRILDRPEELASLSSIETDVILVAHADGRSDVRAWLPTLTPSSTRPPLVVLSEGQVDEPGLAAELRGAGALVVMPIGQPVRLVEAIRLAGGFRRSTPSGDEVGLAEYRRMASLMEKIGHNLRGLLGGIGNAVEVLSFQCPPGALSQRRTIALLDRQCRQMAGLLDDYSEVIRLQSEKARPLEVVELGAFLNRAIDRASTELTDDQVEFDRLPRLDPLWLRIDASGLEHLVRHALLYCARRSPACQHVKLGWSAGDGRIVLDFQRSCEVSVSTGSFSAKDVDMDYYLASLLAERLGGRLTLGASFVVELPLLQAESPAESKAVRVSTSPDGRAVTTSRHVLMVDDNLESIQALGLLIGRLGWHVRITSDIAEALQMIRTIRPRVVTIDLQMPVMDGQTLARLIRDESSIDRPRPLLIGITGTADVPQTDDQGRSCFDHFLTKPVRKDQIASLLPRLEQSA